jgi:hypothetical protein
MYEFLELKEVEKEAEKREVPLEFSAKYWVITGISGCLFVA